MEHVIFFDGFCGVCDAGVSALLPQASRAQLRFAPLQGQTYAALLARRPELKDFDSVVFVEDFGGPGERVHLKGRAVLAILRRLQGFGWGVLRALVAIAPTRLRDGIYDLVARYRHHLAKRRDNCRVATPEERDYLLA